jgi:hypothetical protein
MDKKEILEVEVSEAPPAIAWEEPELIQLESCGSCGNNSGS